MELAQILTVQDFIYLPMHNSGFVHKNNIFLLAGNDKGSLRLKWNKFDSHSWMSRSSKIYKGLSLHLNETVVRNLWNETISSCDFGLSVLSAIICRHRMVEPANERGEDRKGNTRTCTYHQYEIEQLRNDNLIQDSYTDHINYNLSNLKR